MKIFSPFQLIKSVALVAALFCSLNLSAQFNMRIGYTLGFLSPEVNNQILARHNALRSTFFDQYTAAPDLKLAYGLSLGGRYKFGIGSLELGWERVSRTLTSTGINFQAPPLTPIGISQEFQYSLNMIMLTYETNFGLLGIGSSIGQAFVSVKETAIGGNENPSLLDRDADNDQYIARFHLSFNFFGNNTVAFSIKPFIQVGLTNVDMSSLASNLMVSNPQTEESFPMLGISFAFYNGRQ